MKVFGRTLEELTKWKQTRPTRKYAKKRTKGKIRSKQLTLDQFLELPDELGQMCIGNHVVFSSLKGFDHCTARCMNCNKMQPFLKDTVRKTKILVCQECNGYGISSTATQLLDKLATLWNTEILREYDVEGYHFDGYVPKFNLLIESDGSYWHAQPDAVIRDGFKNTIAKEAGFKLIRVVNNTPKDHDVAIRYILDQVHTHNLS